MTETLLTIGILTLLIFLNGLFVAAEFAIAGAPATQIAQLAEEGSRSARRVLAILRNPNLQNRYIATAQLGITVASLALGMYGEQVVAHWLLGPLERLGRLAEPAAHSVAATLAIGLLTYLHVVLGEMIPKSIALESAATTALRLDATMTLTQTIFLPVTTVLNAIGNSIMSALRIPPAATGSRAMSPQELELIVEESFAGGLIQADEQLFIENILDLSERTVGQVMTPRTRLVGLPVDANQEDTLRRICEVRFTRYPVYEDNLDQIVGVLHIKSLARWLAHPNGNFDLRALSSQPVFVPESLSIEKMLVRFRREGLQMAAVVDEYGGVAGIVTIEDLVEEVVGEIHDEFDQEIPPIQVVEPGYLRVRGDVLLAELNQHYDLNLLHPEASTVGGMMMALLGRVLKPGDQAKLGEVEFEVESVEGLAVHTVRVRLPGESESPFAG
jgi:CBS domain containing-hemolysin-like protein